MLNDRAKSSPGKVGTTIKPTPVTDNVTDVAIAPIMTTVSTDSNFEVSVYCFLFFFSFSDFFKQVIFSLLLFELLKQLASFIFYINICSKILFYDGANGCNYNVGVVI